jgi:spermidine/putrescine transport system ATP-binding protein
VSQVPPHKRDVNTVFQHYGLFPHMNVSDNVAYGPRAKKVPKDEVDRRVREVLDIVRLGDFAARRPSQLSGGQQQRVALARALVNRPTVLLLDEPLGALDLKLRKEMQLELKALQREVGITFVYVTHDQEEALTMSDVIVVMRDGLIQQLGSPEVLYRKPANRFVAGFIGSSNFIPGRIREVVGGDRVLVGLAEGLTLTGRLTESERPAVDSEATLALRPESVRLDSPAADGAAARPGWTSIRGRVRTDTYLGDQHEYRVDVPGIGELIARSQAFDLDGGGRAFRPAEDVEVSWHETSALVLTS